MCTSESLCARSCTAPSYQFWGGKRGKRRNEENLWQDRLWPRNVKLLPYTVCSECGKLCEDKIMWHKWSSSNDSTRIHSVAANLGNWHQFPAGHAFLPDAPLSLFLFTFKCQRITGLLSSAWQLHFNAQRRARGAGNRWRFYPTRLERLWLIFSRHLISKQRDSICEGSVANFTRDGSSTNGWITLTVPPVCTERKTLLIRCRMTHVSILETLINRVNLLGSTLFLSSVEDICLRATVLCPGASIKRTSWDTETIFKEIANVLGVWPWQALLCLGF